MIGKKLIKSMDESWWNEGAQQAIKLGKVGNINKSVPGLNS